MKLLVTVFQPFGGQSINPSWEAVRVLEGADTGAEMRLVCLPVEWHAAPDTLKQEIALFHPDCVLMFGQAGGRPTVSIERLGCNARSTKAPDNAGVCAPDDTIEHGAPDALAVTIPYERIYSALKEAGLPVSYSFDAGRYICNLVLWTALEEARTKYPGMRAGFIHLPFLPGQKDGAPCLSLEEQRKAVLLAVKAIKEQ